MRVCGITLTPFAFLSLSYPKQKWNVGPTEDRTSANREVELASVAAIEAVLSRGDTVAGLAGRTDGAIGPQPILQILTRCLFVGKQREELESTDGGARHLLFSTDYVGVTFPSGPIISPRINALVRVLERPEGGFSDYDIANSGDPVSSDQKALERFHFFLYEYVFHLLGLPQFFRVLFVMPYRRTFRRKLMFANTAYVAAIVVHSSRVHDANRTEIIGGR